MSFRLKLIILCLILTSFSVIMGINGRNTNQELIDISSPIGNTILPKVEFMGEMSAQFREIRIHARTLALQGLTPEMINDTEKLALEAVKKYQEADAAYLKLNLTPEELKLHDVVKNNFETFIKEAPTIFAWARSSNPDDRVKLEKFFIDTCPVLALNVYNSIAEIIDYEQKNAAAAVKASEKVAADSSKNSLYYLVGIVVGALVLGFFGSRYLSGSLLNTIKSVAMSLTASSLEVEKISRNIRSSSDHVSQSSTHAASSLEETVASLEELSSMVKTNAQNAQAAENLSMECSKAAQQGDANIQDLSATMANISKSSSKIDEIIGVIDDIAFQTNLLALNAAVEAARAGEHGKGFAVVAEAVRSLAQRSSVAAKDISTIIKESQQVVSQGEKLTSTTGTSFQTIVDSVQKLNALVKEVSHASQEQSAGLQQISQAMNSLDQTTQGNASTSQNLAQSSEHLEKSTEALMTHITTLERSVGASPSSTGAAA